MSVRCRVLFAEDRPGSIVIDCVGAGGVKLLGQDLPPGSPFVIEVDATAAPWMTAARAVLARWVREGCVVDLEFRRLRDTAQVLASDGGTRVLLDVRALAGV